MKIKGISPVADHWRTKAEELERSLARKEVLLRDIEAAMRSPGTNMVGLQTLLKRIERELEGK
jgi:hypothetical protein